MHATKEYKTNHIYNPTRGEIWMMIYYLKHNIIPKKNLFCSQILKTKLQRIIKIKNFLKLGIIRMYNRKNKYL